MIEYVCETMTSFVSWTNCPGDIVASLEKLREEMSQRTGLGPPGPDAFVLLREDVDRLRLLLPNTESLPVAPFVGREIFGVEIHSVESVTEGVAKVMELRMAGKKAEPIGRIAAAMLHEHGG